MDGLGITAHPPAVTPFVERLGHSGLDDPVSEAF